jgi:uncharacterized protein YndB with AHSA1/START domain/calcineurin-like phosphoesterase family protein
MNLQTLSFKQLVKTSPENAFRAFTNATELRGWLSDVATVVPRPGGRFYLWWESEYYTVGEFINVESGKKVSFSWRGRGEPSTTQVEVTFDPQNGGTLVSVDHTGIGSGEEWSQSIPEIEKGWKNGLENLASVFETGEDIRFVSRPMLGILLDEFNEQIAKKLGVPVTKGIRISGTVEGMGAQAAGLQENDVLVSMAGRPTSDFELLHKVLDIHKAGDTVEVVYYRGAEKQSVMMTLSGRPIPEIPPTAQGLADEVATRYKEIETRLDEFLIGISEREASFKPSSSEWSIKGNLAHFIQGERYFLEYIGELVNGHERFADDYGGNIDEMIDATIASYPTLQDLVQEYKRNMDETLYFLAHLPQEFVSRKGMYWRLAYNLLQDPYHFEGHLEQMQTALDAARQ